MDNLAHFLRETDGAIDGCNESLVCTRAVSDHCHLVTRLSIIACAHDRIDDGTHVLSSDLIIREIPILANLQRIEPINRVVAKGVVSTSCACNPDIEALLSQLNRCGRQSLVCSAQEINRTGEHAMKENCWAFGRNQGRAKLI